MFFKQIKNNNMEINYTNIFKTLKVEHTEELEEKIQSKLKSLEKILIELNEKEEQMTAKHIRNILTLYGYKICF